MFPSSINHKLKPPYVGVFDSVVIMVAAVDEVNLGLGVVVRIFSFIVRFRLRPTFCSKNSNSTGSNKNGFLVLLSEWLMKKVEYVFLVVTGIGSMGIVKLLRYDLEIPLCQ